jgi:hypothetical protein
VFHHRRIGPVSVFYLLPPRATVAAHFARYLEGWFPGGGHSVPELADRLAEAVQSRTDSYAVFADELPQTDGFLTTLRESFGAAAGDWVIDLRGGPQPAADARPLVWLGADHIFPPRGAAAC